MVVHGNINPLIYPLRDLKKKKCVVLARHLMSNKNWVMKQNQPRAADPH